MSANENRPEAASEDLAGGLISSNLNEDVYGTEPWRAAYETFLRGWVKGRASLERELAMANAAADVWYLRANHSPAEIREMRLRAMDDAWREYWNAGMPTDAVTA